MFDTRTGGIQSMWKHNDAYSAMEAGELNADTAASFYDKQVRQGFMRKVFGILSIQLLVTSAMCATFVTSKSVHAYFMAGHSWPLWTSMLFSFGILIAMMCNPMLARTFPTNYALLGLFTIAESVMVGAVCMMSEPTTVLAAAGVTTGIVIGLTLFAMQSKYDFTTATGMLSSALLTFILVSLVGIFFPQVQWLQLAIAGVGALIFSAYLVVDVQLLMDGKSMQISPDDYILGALSLYLDILNLFLYILQILNTVTGNSSSS